MAEVKLGCARLSRRSDNDIKHWESTRPLQNQQSVKQGTGLCTPKETCGFSKGSQS